MKTFIIIEIFDREYPVIVTNHEGFPLLFDTREEAELVASESQNGIVIEY